MITSFDYRNQIVVVTFETKTTGRVKIVKQYETISNSFEIRPKLTGGQVPVFAHSRYFNHSLSKLITSKINSHIMEQYEGEKFNG